ncbi:MAG: carboxymuconolactone decarboxylase family protein [Novosphingobium sp.]|nr:carboxymuconolactone decarboxylase family protein [Novosphingobium sp.]
MADTGEAEFDIAARMAQVVGEQPRVEPLGSEALDPVAVEMVRRIRASAGASDVDQLPEYMRTVIKHPELFRCNMDMGNTLFNGKLPKRERELAILRIAWLMRAPFEWGQHVIIAKRLGFSSEEIDRARRGTAAGGWSEHEAAILSGVEELIADTSISDQTWNTLAKSWDEQQLIEFPMMVGQYVSTAYVQNALKVRMETGNPGLSLG